MVASWQAVAEERSSAGQLPIGGLTHKAALTAAMSAVASLHT